MAGNVIAYSYLEESKVILERVYKSLLQSGMNILQK
jgi:hypothetical protein